MAQLCLWTKIRTKIWLVLGASTFQCMRAGFLCPKCDNFACLHTRQYKMGFIWKDDFLFFLPKSTSSVSRSQAHLAKHIEAYIQPYSFVGRIKQIICQIRHELSVTIHEIRTSWKKTLDGGPYIIILMLLWRYEFYPSYYWNTQIRVQVLVCSQVHRSR